MGSELLPDFGPPLARNSPVPLWAQVEQRLVSSIWDGTLVPGERLEPQLVLCRRFAVSRSTLRQALHGLQRRGVIVSGPRRGAYVAINVHDLLDDLANYQ